MSSLSSVPPLGINGISSSTLVPSSLAAAPVSAAPSSWNGGQTALAPPQGLVPATPTIQQAVGPASGGGASLVTMPREASEEPSLAAQTTGGSNIGLIVILSTLGINLAMLGGFAAMPLIELNRKWARNAGDIEGSAANDKLREASCVGAAEAANKAHVAAYAADNHLRVSGGGSARYLHVEAPPLPMMPGK